MTGFIVTGTDTGIGKTVFCAALVGAIRGVYFKPVQAGLDEETDSEVVSRLAALAPERLIPEAYRLRLPASPHIAAKREGIQIHAGDLTIPSTSRPLIVEGAGGLLVPLSSRLLQIDMFRTWNLPAILCARTALGTINHTLLSLEALERRDIRVFGVAFIGDQDAEAEQTIIEMGRVRRLGRLPWIASLSPSTLQTAFVGGFNVSDFL